MKNNCSVSFIIPNWNHKELLNECIASIYDTSGALPCEVIVIDNASTDGSAAHIKNRFPEVLWLQNKYNLGYAKAVNQGVKLSQGNFIFLLNNDVRLVNNATEKLITLLTNTTEAGASAPLLYYPDGRMQVSCRRFPTPSALLLEYLGINSAGPYHKWKLTLEDHLKADVVQQPMASALMIKRECWDAVGPMDEGFPIFYNDVDWCYRLYRDTDYKIYLCREAKAIHHEGASVKRMGYKKKLEFYKSLLRFYLKHFLTLIGSSYRHKNRMR